MSEDDLSISDDQPKNYLGGEDPDLNFLERFKRFERITQFAVVMVWFFSIAVIFWLKWFNYHWWLVYPLALFILITLQKQRTVLLKSKPFEAKISKILFTVFLVLLIIRDLILTIIVN